MNAMPTCECGHFEVVHFFYCENCLECDCGNYEPAEVTA